MQYYAQPVTLMLNGKMIYGYQLPIVTIEAPKPKKIIIDKKNGVIPESWRVKNENH